MMDEHVEHVVDHAKVSRQVRVLALDVGEISGEGIEAGRGEPKYFERGPGAFGEKRDGIVGHAESRRLGDAGSRSGLLPEHRRHLAEDRPGRIDPCERDAIALDNQRTLDKYIQRARVAALFDEDLTCVEGGCRQVGTVRQQTVHRRERRR